MALGAVQRARRPATAPPGPAIEHAAAAPDAWIRGLSGRPRHELRRGTLDPAGRVDARPIPHRSTRAKAQRADHDTVDVDRLLVIQDPAAPATEAAVSPRCVQARDLLIRPGPALGHAHPVRPTPSCLTGGVSTVHALIAGCAYPTGRPAPADGRDCTPAPPAARCRPADRGPCTLLRAGRGKDRTRASCEPDGPVGQPVGPFYSVIV